MSSSFEKSVRGATKIKNAPPKTKYIEHILVATHSGESGVADVLFALQNRLRDSTWTVVFKSLITIHLMMREGSPDVTLSYISRHRNMLAISHFADAVTQGRNIRHYSTYLAERVRSYRDTGTDWVRVGENKLENTTVEKGLLRQTESVQRQLHALLKCDLLLNEPENEITITAFRLLVLDLLSLFQVANQGLINILGRFFEMSKPDAERAMDIYRTFTRQTEVVVAFLGVARQHEYHTRVEVPKLKHAPVHLARQLEDYLKDPDFEVNRRQYIAEQTAKRKADGTAQPKPFLTKKTDSEAPTSSSSSKPAPADNNPFPTSGAPAGTKAETQTKDAKGPEPDLIDFFESIEQNQTPMQVPQPTGIPANNAAAFQQPQPTGIPLQSNNPMFQQPQPTGIAGFQQQQQQQQQQPQLLQPHFTGAGFGGFTPQPQPQQSFQPGLGAIPQETPVNSFLQQPQQQQPQQPQQTGLQPMQTGGLLQPMQTGTNPFRQSMLTPQPTGLTGLQQQQPPGSPVSMLSTPTGNPAGNRQSTNPFARASPTQSPYNSASNSPLPQQQALAPAPTGAAAAPLQPAPTGTNPFTRKISPQPTAQSGMGAPGGLAPQPTGNTNPFRQSSFVDHNTGMGWQHNQQPIGGGLDQLATQPVFPRPTQQSPWQQ
ncbi:phosphatidylinositol-binding clathrin assembly protein [Geosmithia morbida]|uniref:Phosphatidylinositol-binding clathrin assembly protein n=1 Tax=Geosmithia morbida TaxID=1094350 RepID=A0A9P5D6L4_9HYPO|nr:phosphatidylinositol-binding clathrin assembly protein [Geosmithia morbida]KAF4124880.1 phosphatidylinositol-binding clathrin assembly protein [Geosmithia morbida]